MIKNRTAYLFSFLFFALSSQTSLGQGMAARGWAVPAHWGWQHRTAPLLSSIPFAPLSSDVSISYFDPSAPTHSWFIPSFWNAAEMIALTEHIALPTDSGYLDSVRIVFDSISGDSVGVTLDPDTVLFNSAAGGGEYEHLDATVFNTSLNSFGQATIYPSQLHSDTVIVPFQHIKVPKNFHVGLVPSISSAGVPTSLFAIRGDSEAQRVRTLENARSTYIVVSSGRIFSGVIDSNLVPPGDTVPLYSNMYITAYVSATPSSVAGTEPIGTLSIFPNPASSFLEFHGNEFDINSVDILDMLGRTILSGHLDGNDHLDVSGLEPGRYEAIVHGTNAILTEPFIIER